MDGDLTKLSQCRKVCSKSKGLGLSCVLMGEHYSNE